MKIKNRFTELIVKAYFNESIYSAILDFIAVLMVFVVLVFVSKQTDLSMLFVVCVVAFYIVLSSILNHTLSLLIWLDLKDDVIKITTAKVLGLKIESSWSGHLWHSLIKDFFPKEKDVKRIKILVELDNGKRMCLRTLMSFERRMLFFDAFINEKNFDAVKLHYLPKSKLLLSIDDSIDCKNKKRMQVIKKINYSL